MTCRASPSEPKANLQAAGLADRCQVVGGNFFESVPAGADAYLMRHIIHDWEDRRRRPSCRTSIGRWPAKDGCWSWKA